MNYGKTISHINGNGKRYTLPIPTLLIPKFGNDTAKENFEKQTGLLLQEKTWNGNYVAHPKSFKQIYKVFVTYNFKTTYYNNWDLENTLKLEWNMD